MSDGKIEERKARTSKSKRPREEGTRPAQAARRDEPSAKTPSKASTKKTGALLMAACALAAGVVTGWFGRGAVQPAAGATNAPDDAKAAASSTPGPAGSCGDWANDVCERAGAESEGCAQARAASEVLPASACTAARAELDATVAKIKAARQSCDDLADKLCGDLGKDTKTCAMVRGKLPSFPASRCAEMLTQYDGVIAELRQMEKSMAPISADLAARQSTGDAPGFGSPDAKVTVVVYSDFQCPFCARAAKIAHQLESKYGDRIRFVFRQYPLAMHPDASLAAEASLAAHAQGKFWALHDAMFENQRELDRKSLERLASKAGLDMAKFKRALDEHTYATRVKSDMKLGDEAGVSGTPTMFIGAERVDNPTDFASVSRQIDEKLAVN